MAESRDRKIVEDTILDFSFFKTEHRKKLKEIFEKLENKEGLDHGDINCLHKIKDSNAHVKQISSETIEFSKALHTRSTKGFAIVMSMYIFAFAFGIALLISALQFAYDDKESLAVAFGLIGGGEMAFLLYRPAKEIIKSRASATQLLALFREMQFISIWSGKTYGKLYDQIGDEYNQIQEKNLEQMKELLKLKTDLTIKFVNAIEKYVKQDYDSKNTADNSEETSGKSIKLDKANFSKATGTDIEKLDYSNLEFVKQEKDFRLGEDKNKGKGPSEKFWTSVVEEEEFKEKPDDEAIKIKYDKIPKPDKPEHKCSQGCDWQVVLEWKQWSLFKQKKEGNWVLRCYSNIQWECAKKPSQVESKDE